jgi:hypothetical protein
MSSEEKTTAVLEMRRYDAVARASTEGPRALGSGPDAASTAAERQVTETALDIEGCRKVDRTSIEALESLLGELQPGEAITLRLSLGSETPLSLGIALDRGGSRHDTEQAEARRQELVAALQFATALLNARRRP